jgi:hypothetical protein
MDALLGKLNESMEKLENSMLTIRLPPPSNDLIIINQDDLIDHLKNLNDIMLVMNRKLERMEMKK